MRLGLLAAALAAAVPLAGPASARCAPAFQAVCTAYYTVCDEVRDTDPTGRVCSFHP